MTRSRVNVDVFWLPFHEQRGRLVATRRVRAPGMDVTEFWSSELVDAVGLVGITTVRSTHEWTRLVRNERVPLLPGPVPLTECLPGSPILAEIEQRLRDSSDSGGALQPLASANIELTLPAAIAGDRVDTAIQARCADLTHKPDDIFALPFSTVLNAAVRPLELQQIAPPEVVPSAPANDASIADAISFERVRGAQVGHYNVQFNTFIAEYRSGKFTFDQVIGRERVTRAIRDLQDEPGNTDLRRALVAALQDNGWDLFETPRCMTVGRQHKGLLDFLESLLGFEVKGLQTGNANLQRNSFVYQVTRTPDAAALLGRNRSLATALADVLCPQAGSGRNMDALRDNLAQQLNGMPIKWADGITRGVSYKLGTISLLRDHDGVSIGNSIVVNQERTDVHKPGIRVEAPAPSPRPDRLPEPPWTHPELPSRTITRHDERLDGPSLPGPF